MVSSKWGVRDRKPEQPGLSVAVVSRGGGGNLDRRSLMADGAPPGETYRAASTGWVGLCSRPARLRWKDNLFNNGLQ